MFICVICVIKVLVYKYNDTHGITPQYIAYQIAIPGVL